MGRKPESSPESIDRALQTIHATQSAIELRRALAVALPVLHGLSLKQTAALVGRSETWVAKERSSFIKDSLRQLADRPSGGRRNQLIPAEEEDAFMEMVCQRFMRVRTEWRVGVRNSPTAHREAEMSFIEHVIAALEERIQRKTTKTTAYNLMARTGKRRFPNYEPYMWSWACRQKLPSAIYSDDDIGRVIAQRYGLKLTKKRPRQ